MQDIGAPTRLEKRRLVPPASGAGNLAFNRHFARKLVIDRFQELLLAHFARLDLREAEDMVDDLLFVNRGAQLSQGLAVVAVEIPDLLFLAGKRPRPGDQRLGHLLVRDLHFGPCPDLGQEEPEADPPFGDLAIVAPGRLLGRLLIGEAAARGLLLAHDLFPNRIELLADEALGQFERIALVELVEQLTLELVARSARIIGGDPVADRFPKLVEAFIAEALGEFIVDGERIRRGDGLHRHRKVAGLARQRPYGVGLGKGRANDALVACGDAHELVLESRQERVRTERHLDVPAFAALKGNAVDGSIEIYRDAVMRLGSRARRLVTVRATLPDKPVERGVDIGWFDVGGQALERDLREIANLEDRQNLERDLEVEIAAGLEGGFDRGLVARKLDLGLAGEAQMVVVDDLLVGAGDGLLDDFGHHRLAVNLAQMLDRHLARAEAVEADLLLELGELSVELRGEVARGQRNIVLALQALAERLGHLHLAFLVAVPADRREWPMIACRPIVNWRVRGREGNGAGGGT